MDNNTWNFDFMPSREQVDKALNFLEALSKPVSLPSRQAVDRLFAGYEAVFGIGYAIIWQAPKTED